LPKDFGLTDAGIKKLEKTSGWIRGFVAMLPGVLLLFKFGAPSDPSDLTLGTTLILGFIIVFVLSPLAYTIVEQIIVRWWPIVTPFWLFWHPDYSKYKQYQLAQKRYKNDYDEWLKTQLSWWQRLSGQRFEQEIGAVFEKRGYQVYLQGKSGDGGVDLIISKGSQRIIVQCKAHKNPIGPHVVRDLYGALTHNKARKAWIVSVSRFTKGSWEFAVNKPIRLITIEDILTERFIVS